VGGWRRLHNEGLHNLYAPPNIIVIKPKRKRGEEHVARMSEMRNAYIIFIGQHEGKSLLGRPRCRWERNITIEFREIEREDVDWMHFAEDRDQWRALVNLRVP